jgi:hypothetical protein
MRAAAQRRAPALFCEESDEALDATTDYFLARQWGLLEEHTPETWQSFREGYRVMGDAYRTYANELHAAAC